MDPNKRPTRKSPHPPPGSDEKPRILDSSNSIRHTGGPRLSKASQRRPEQGGQQSQPVRPSYTPAVAPALNATAQYSPQVQYAAQPSHPSYYGYGSQADMTISGAEQMIPDQSLALVTASDKIKELEGQVRYHQEAKQKLKEENRILTLHLMSRGGSPDSAETEQGDPSSEQQESAEEATVSNDTTTELSQQIQLLEAENENLRKQLDEARDLCDLEKKALEKKIEDALSAQSEAEKRANELEQEKAELEADLKASQKNLHDARNEIQDLELHVESVGSLYKEAVNKISELKNKENDLVEALKAEVMDLKRERQETIERHELDRDKDRIWVHDTVEENKILKKRITDFKKRVRDAEELLPKVRNLQEQLRRSEDSNHQLQEQLERFEASNVQLQESVQSYEDERQQAIESATALITSLSPAIEFLRPDMLERFREFEATVRAGEGAIRRESGDWEREIPETPNAYASPSEQTGSSQLWAMRDRNGSDDDDESSPGGEHADDRSVEL